MSGPTKGMVAGQPIQTGAQTKEFDEGYERIFGKDRKPNRGRYVWDAQEGRMVEVGADWEPTDRVGPPRKSEEEIYGRDVAQDGADISSRRKRREYMKSEGVADASDYAQTWRKAKAEREAFFTNTSEKEKRRTKEAVVEAWHKLRKP